MACWDLPNKEMSWLCDPKMSILNASRVLHYVTIADNVSCKNKKIIYHFLPREEKAINSIYWEKTAGVHFSIKKKGMYIYQDPQ